MDLKSEAKQRLQDSNSSALIKKNKLENLEIDILLEAIYRRYAYDFRNYARSSLKRRIEHLMKNNKFTRISDMLSELLHDEELFNHFLTVMSITVTEMYRDPSFYIALREKVIPFLKTYPYIKIWHAGCATGEEVYSMAILLEEEGFYDRCQIYATDFNTHALDIAKEGIYSAERMKLFTQNYLKAGGNRAFSDYYHAQYDSAKLDRALKRNITFAHHNMAHDSTFGEMNLIICRNVMIYFNKTLQSKVLELFLDSLASQGILCLGNKESIDYTSVSDHFKVISRSDKIYKKKS